MVLYVNVLKGGKAEKTNWVMHQYHLGTGEDEMEGDYVISKVFYQQQQVKQSEKGEAPLSDGIDDALVTDVHQISPKSVTPETSRPERCFPDYDEEKDLAPTSVVIPAKVHQSSLLSSPCISFLFKVESYYGEHYISGLRSPVFDKLSGAACICITCHIFICSRVYKYEQFFMLYYLFSGFSQLIKV